jgi:hypothetical protein
VTTVAICADGDPRSATTVLALGDSHAATWQPAWAALAGQRGWRFLNVTKSGCTPWDVPVTNSNVGGRYVACETWRRNAVATAARERPAVVILHGTMPWEEMLDARGRAVRPAARPAALAAGVAATIRALRGTGATVVAMLDTPAARSGGTAVQDCLATTADPARCDFPAAHDVPERAVVARAARAAGAVLVDPYPVICPGQTCAVVQDGVVVYRDTHHLTRTYVLHELPWVRSWLDPLVSSRP